MELTIIKKLDCKKNGVFLATGENGEKVILKKYANTADAETERIILNKISVTGYAPKVLESGNGYNINEYVEGEIFSEKYKDYTQRDDAKGLERLANELSIYLQIFYSLADGYILDKVNFNNFIIKDGRCYGIDYDSVSQGMQYSDIAGVVAYAAYHAVGGLEAAMPFINKFLQNFHLDVMDIIIDVKKHLARLSPVVDVDELADQLISANDL